MEQKLEQTVTTYAIRFDHPDSRGNIIKKDAVNTWHFDKMKKSGEIIDYKIDDKGVLIKKAHYNEL